MTSHETPPPTRAVVLFDLDGVLTARDTFATLVIRRLRKQPWRLLLALPALPVLVASRYRPRVRGGVSRYLVRIALLGEAYEGVQDECRALGTEFAATPTWLLQDGIDQLQDHLRRGDRVIVVTATETGLARALLVATGLAGAEVMGSRLSRGRMGLGLAPHNYGAQKVRSLEAAGVERPWTSMVSDSLADLPLLAEVEQAYFVNGAPRDKRLIRTRLPATRLPAKHVTWG